MFGEFGTPGEDACDDGWWRGTFWVIWVGKPATEVVWVEKRTADMTYLEIGLYQICCQAFVPRSYHQLSAGETKYHLELTPYVIPRS